MYEDRHVIAGQVCVNSRYASIVPYDHNISNLAVHNRHCRLVPILPIGTIMCTDIERAINNLIIPNKDMALANTLCAYLRETRYMTIDAILVSNAF